MTKQCSKCKELKQAPEDFHRMSASKDGYHPYCKVCVATYDRERKQNPEYRKARRIHNQTPERKAVAHESNIGRRGYMAEYMAEYSKTPKARAYKHAWVRKFTQSNPEKIMLRSAKSRAKATNLPFDITMEDITIPTHCSVFSWLKLERHLGEGIPGPDSPSLDKIHPRLGYVKGNVRVISNRANSAKSNLTFKEIEALYNDAKLCFDPFEE